MELKNLVAAFAAEELTGLTGQTVSAGEVLVNLTDVNFPGDYTVVLFPFIKSSGKNPQELGQYLGEKLQQRMKGIQAFHLVKGFLNLEFTPQTWMQQFIDINETERFGIRTPGESGTSVLIEYPSPNTNKPLHLGHLRNIFLGSSLSNILEANGHKVIQVCLYNDRGTNISKSMLMYQKATEKLTPETSGIKPDKLVAEYYVRYSTALKEEIQQLITSGLSEEEARKQSTLEKEVAELTVKWEEGDVETRALWEMMNGWFYSGVAVTYKNLALHFDKFYYESDVYHLGKETVKDGLEKGIFYTKADGSVWINLEEAGLDEKVVLRSNGTSVYITQDMALAYQKQKEFQFDTSVYVVGNEQDYHFKVLFEILKRLGLQASENLYHLSYGMVELPTGRMKTREGSVVDADDMLQEVVAVAREKADEQGKLSEVSPAEKEEIYKMIGQGALRYFILKVDPKKRILYNPEESIDFNGNTSPFIQYTYARTQSLKRNAAALGIKDTLDQATIEGYTLNDKEIKLVRFIQEFPVVLSQAAKEYSPALIANYVYQLAADFSTYYHDYKVLKEENEQARNFRLVLSIKTGQLIREGLHLLGIEAPSRM